MRVGIAGYGVVGKRRRQYIDANPHFKTVAVSDIAFSEARVWPDGVEFFTSWESMLERPLDVLFVCVPNDVAPIVTVAGLDRGIHVFCEKPPGRTVEDIRRVLA